MRQPITKISFNPAVASRYTRAEFIAKYSKLYPGADLAAYADSLGLISEPVAHKAPATIKKQRTKSKALHGDNRRVDEKAGEPGYPSTGD